mmetsp:Transcript_29381/g.59208  ORF Transcript_29381/g.59208 Transcript_29381/m.59208 type:complete len:104 (+) Transcript_29381:78-389(+)
MRHSPDRFAGGHSETNTELDPQQTPRFLSLLSSPLPDLLAIAHNAAAVCVPEDRGRVRTTRKQRGICEKEDMSGNEDDDDMRKKKKRSHELCKRRRERGGRGR